MFPPREFWIIVTEWDCDPAVAHGEKAEGPLVHEGYCARLATKEQAQARLKMLSNSYGRAVAILIQPEGLGTLELNADA